MGTASAPTVGLPPRHDKWYLGAGDGLIWAPPFPVHLDAPGFWDEAHLAQYPIGPLFTLSFVMPGGEPLEARLHERSWTPDALVLEYRLGNSLVATETRSAPGDRTLSSEWTLRNRGRRALDLRLVLWTAQDGMLVDDAIGVEGGVRVSRRLRDRKGQEAGVSLRYGLSPGPANWAAYRSEPSGPIPDFRLTPFYDRWDSATGLAGEARLDGLDRRGLVYAGLERRLRLAPGKSARFVGRVRVSLAGEATAAPGPQGGSPAVRARRQWRAELAEYPGFRCTDPFLERYWTYRWYGLRLNRIAAGLGQYRHDTIAEGIGYFHQPISYSAMCHVRELAWRHSSSVAQGVVRTFFDHLRDDGSMPGRVYLDHLVEPDFYHSDWGGALEILDAVHPDRAWLRSLYPRLSRYARWLLSTRDADESGMIDVTDQYETGQEYMSRYEAVDPDADRYGWENRIRLKGIDVTVYAYRLYRLLAEIASEPHDRPVWDALAERTARAVREQMWDPDAGMFFDVNPQTGSRTGVKAAVSFYPYFTDLAGAEHAEAMGRHLFNPGEFWTPYPVPSSSADDPRFNPDAEWKGKRHVCPWNGRVWPMANSHVVEALARVVRHHRPDWADRLVQLTRQFVRMMFFDGDPARPNCFEHYHPMTGRASVYRGIDDYQHSWVNSLIVNHVAGLLPRGAAGFVMDPMPFGERLSLSNVRIAGRRVDVVVDRDRWRVKVDGRQAATGPVGQAREVVW